MPRQASTAAARRRGGTGGRILPHERDTNDDTDILGAEIHIENFNEDVQQTLEHEMKDSTRKNYRNRIQAIVKYWKTYQQDYYNIGVRQVNDDDLRNPSKYYYGKYKEDIVYSGMNADFFIKFLLDTKLKGNGKMKQYEDVRKYKDAILWASGVIEERLPTSFYHKVERYLKSYKLLVTQAKKDGRVDERGADPISFTFYKLLLQWTIETNNIFLWFWTLAQWNNMARCASIDPLGFNNFKLGCDSIICKYDDSKTKKDGEKLSEKNIYANPSSYEQCFWTGMGVFCALNADRVSINGKLFLTEGAKEGSAASRYQEQLLGLMKKKADVVSTHIRLDHANAYGIRKGSATYATSGTTSPPPIPSIARRGEWSMGVVLDVYWHFAEPGDHYLGRILSGLDPSDPSFGVLPPHFVVLNPMQNVHIKQAMEILYGPILKSFGPHSTVISVLLRCLASIVYHSEKLLLTMQQDPGHDFNKIMLLQDPGLLRALRPLVTLEPTEGVMTVATGIPPHITLAKQAKLIFDRCGEILQLLSNQSTELIHAVKQAIEDKAFEQGHMTYDRLSSMFEQFKEHTLKQQKEQLDDMRNEFVNIVSTNSAINRAGTNTIARSSSSTSMGNIFCYGGKFFDVPQNYSFPKKVNLRTGLNFWLNGHHISESCIVKPFRCIKSSMLPSNLLKNEFKLQWKGVYDRFLSDIENAVLPLNQNHFSHDELEKIYEKLVEHLRTRFSFCFLKGDPLLDWKLGTWYNRTSRSSVVQRGSDADKLLLPEETRWNMSTGRQNKRKRTQMASVLYPHRRQQGLDEEQ